MSLDAVGRGAIGGAAANGQAVFGNGGINKSGAGNEMPFEELVKGLIQETSHEQSAVADNVKKLVSGEADSIHDVVLTASRADLAFRLVMEIRNRLISSYQEIMRMQV